MHVYETHNSYYVDHFTSITIRGKTDHLVTPHVDLKILLHLIKCTLYGPLGSRTMLTD